MKNWWNRSNMPVLTAFSETEYVEQAESDNLFLFFVSMEEKLVHGVCP